MTDTIYTAPQSNLSQPQAAGQYGSLERGIAGDYPFSIRAILGEAWQKTSGAKLTMVLAGILYFAIYMGAAVALGFVTGTLSADPAQKMTMTGFAVNLVVGVVGTLLGMGLFMMGLRRAVGAPITVTMLFETLPLFVPVVVTLVLVYLMIVLGLVLLIIPGIYLAVSYYLALPLVVEKKLGAWQAMEASRKAITNRWFRTLGLVIALTVINMLGAIPLGIGLIWTAPMSLIAFGILYRNVFGVEPATTAG